MLEILTMLTDVALGAIAYRLARQNLSALESLTRRVEKLEKANA